MNSTSFASTVFNVLFALRTQSLLWLPAVCVVAIPTHCLAQSRHSINDLQRPGLSQDLRDLRSRLQNDATASNSPSATRLQDLIRQERSTREILKLLVELDRADALRELGSDRLAFSSWDFPGWRREYVLMDGRVICAKHAGFLIAIRYSRTVEVSVVDLAGTESIGSRTRHITAMSPSHLTRKDAELAQLFYFFSGPLREPIGIRGLP